MISKEDFSKLNQLDRIEYLLKLKRIEESSEKSEFGLGYSLKMLLFVVGFIILIFLGLANIVGVEKALPIINTSIVVTRVFSIIIIIGIIWDIINTLIFRKNKRDLESEFFKFKVKTKRK